MKIINYEKNKQIPLTDKETEFYEKQKVCYICKKKLVQINMIKVNLNYSIKSEIIAILQENLESHSQYLQFEIQNTKNIPVMAHNLSTYDDHFIIKQLAKEFGGQFEYLGKIQKNIILFQHQLKQSLIMADQLHTN